MRKIHIIPSSLIAALTSLIVLSIANALPTPAPAEPMIRDGLGVDGRLHLEVGQQVILKPGRPYKRLTVGSPDLVEINAIGPTQVLATGKSPGQCDMTIWDDNDVSQTFKVVVVGAGAAIVADHPRDVWADDADPVATAIPGFIQFNLRGRTIHLPLAQVLGLAIEDARPSKASGNPPTTAPAKQTRIVLSPASVDVHGDPSHTLVIPAARMAPDAVIAVLRRAAQLPPSPAPREPMK